MGLTDGRPGLKTRPPKGRNEQVTSRAMIAITTSSSISVKAGPARFLTAGSSIKVNARRRAGMVSSPGLCE